MQTAYSHSTPTRRRPSRQNNACPPASESAVAHAQRYETLKNEYDALLALRQKKKEDQDRLSQFIAMLKGQAEIPVQFHEDLWLATVDKVTVHPYHVVFTFRGGFEITEEI